MRIQLQTKNPSDYMRLRQWSRAPSGRQGQGSPLRLSPEVQPWYGHTTRQGTILSSEYVRPVLLRRVHTPPVMIGGTFVVIKIQLSPFTDVAVRSVESYQ